VKGIPIYGIGEDHPEADSLRFSEVP